MTYTVGKCRLPTLLRQRKMTQTELANRLGIKRQQINKYALGHITMSLQIAYNIAAVLDCSIYDLYEWEFKGIE